MYKRENSLPCIKSNQRYMYFYGIGKQPPPLILSLEREKKKNIYLVYKICGVVLGTELIFQMRTRTLWNMVSPFNCTACCSHSHSQCFATAITNAEKIPCYYFLWLFRRRRTGSGERKRIYMDFVYRFLSCFRLQLLSINIHLFPCKIILTPPKESRIIG